MSRRTLSALGAAAIGSAALCGSASAATITVENRNDSGAGSLRQAIIEANEDSSVDTIEFADDVRDRINVDHGQLQVDSRVRISGPGSGALTVSGRNQNRVFRVTRSATATIAGLTISDGSAPSGSQGRVGDNAIGGGIDNAGTLTLRRVRVVDNLALGGPGDRLGGDAYGGGISNSGTLTLDGSAVQGNRSRGSGARLGGNGLGGGISNSGKLVLSDSTVSGNVASGGDGKGSIGIGGDAIAGGIRNAGAGSSTLTNSTVSGNVAAAGTGGSQIPFISLDGWAFGGGVLNGDVEVGERHRVVGGDRGSVSLTGVTLTGNQVSSKTAAHAGNANMDGGATFQSSLVSAGGGDANCSRNQLSLGFNLDDGDSCGFAKPTDRTRTDPKLGPLQDNGGPTRTHALALSSPALDQGSSPGLSGDQRGFTRPVRFPDLPKPPGGDGSDIGAFEVQSRADAFPELVGTVTPQRAPVRTHTCFRLTAEQRGGGAVSGVRVTLGGERKHTRPGGGAVICKRFGRPGDRSARFRKPGFAEDLATVRVTRRAGSGG